MLCTRYSYSCNNVRSSLRTGRSKTCFNMPSCLADAQRADIMCLSTLVVTTHCNSEHTPYGIAVQCSRPGLYMFSPALPVLIYQFPLLLHLLYDRSCQHLVIIYVNHLVFNKTGSAIVASFSKKICGSQSMWNHAWRFLNVSSLHVWLSQYLFSLFPILKMPSCESNILIYP